MLACRVVVDGVEADDNVHSEDTVDEDIKPQHDSARVLLEGDPPWYERHAVRDHDPHEQVPQQLAWVLYVCIVWFLLFVTIDHFFYIACVVLYCTRQTLLISCGTVYCTD